MQRDPVWQRSNRLQRQAAKSAQQTLTAGGGGGRRAHQPVRSSAAVCQANNARLSDPLCLPKWAPPARPSLAEGESPSPLRFRVEAGSERRGGGTRQGKRKRKYWAPQKNLVKGCRQTVDCYCACCELLSASTAGALLFVNILVSGIFHGCFAQRLAVNKPCLQIIRFVYC